MNSATVHGMHGETTDAAIVGPDVDAAGLYVGLTRGRRANTAVVVAPSTTALPDEVLRRRYQDL